MSDRSHAAAAPEQLRTALAGRYEVERELGRGGMATVYLVRDLKHHRHVALKLLDPELGAVLGADRFLSEIRVTANLQHPNLLPLFDSGEAGGLLFYVMPYVQGESLRHRMDREKHLPVGEAVRIATAIASALDYAHRQGVIHRDLKPENILLQDGQPLIADFGIALAVSNAGGTRVTQTGLSLGTPLYMSPEQATGDRDIDGRADIYSLGAVTYEMLSGEPPHVGTTAQAIIARLMTEEPRPLAVTRHAVPEHVDAAVRGALEKLPADRFQTAKEFADALNGHAIAPTAMGSAAAWRGTRARAVTARWLTILGAAIAITAAGTWLLASRAQPLPKRVRLEFGVPPGQTLMDPAGVSLTVSPDGESIAYLARTGGRTMIHVRRLDDWQGRPLAGTEDAYEPRFSPDGRWILFGVGSLPKKVAIDGGAPIELPSGTGWNGAAWGTPETIVLAGTRKLLALSPNGGTPRVIFAPDSASGVLGVNDPFVLPGGKTVAFRLTTATGSQLATVPTSGGQATTFDFPFANAIGYDRGWLLFGRPDGTIAAVELKDEGRKLGGRVVQLLDGASYKSSGGVVAAVSPAGTLAYLEGARGGRIIFMERNGAIMDGGSRIRWFTDPQFSPDGKRVALTSIVNSRPEIGVLEIATNTLSRLTAGARAAWTPDGKRIVFMNDSTRLLSWMPADASGPPEQLTTEPFLEAQVTPDGRSLVARGQRGGTRSDIFLIPLDGDRTPVPLLATAANELMPRVSPDGRWLAYVSNESGELEVYVRPLKGGARTQISPAGGVQPVWAPDGRQIYYMNNSVIFAAHVQAMPASLGVVRRDSLFGVNLRGVLNGHQMFDVSPDGRRFVGIDAQGSELKLKVVVNWLDEARAKLK